MKRTFYTGWARERQGGFQLHVKVTKEDDHYVVTHGDHKAIGDDEAEATRKLKAELERAIYSGTQDYSGF